MDNAVKVAHTADLHIDASTIGEDSRDGVHSAWESATKVWHAICQHVADSDVEVFVVPGDLFKDGRPSPEAMERVAEGFRIVSRAGKRTVLSPGNHERIRLREGYRTALERYADIDGVFFCDKPGIYVDGPTGLQVAVIPWVSKGEVTSEIDASSITDPSELDEMTTAHIVDVIDSLAAQIDPSKPSVLAGHLTVSTTDLHGGAGRGSEIELHHIMAEPVVPIGALERGPWGYVALGHIHKRQSPGSTGRVWYPGSPERLSFSEARDPKTFNVATVSADPEDTIVEHVPTPARKLVTISSETNDFGDGDLTDALVRVELNGEQTIDAGFAEMIASMGGTIADVRQSRRSVSGVNDLLQSDNGDPVDDSLSWSEYVDLWVESQGLPDEKADAMRGIVAELLDGATVD